jgi:hypothetical protein
MDEETFFFNRYFKDREEDEKMRLPIAGRLVEEDPLFRVQSSELLYDWRFTTNQFVLATRPLRPTTRICIFQLNTCRYSPCVTSSLTRGWICRIQLLLALASAVIFRSESRLLSQIRDSPQLEGQIPVFISPRKRVSRLYPQALGSLFVVSYDSQG